MWVVRMSLVVGLVCAVAAKSPMACEEARIKCAYRVGCGMALQNYMVGCSAVLQGPERTHCPEVCQHALIALTSTEEGKELMMCQCSDDFCVDSKKRVEVCRPQVIMANKNETIVSCRVAQWICAADALCSTALDYYNRFCRSMFHGKKCTHRCLNSISILRRQEKAAKLKTCRCDGLEEYDCPRIQSNMARLCFHKKVPVAEETPAPPIGGDTETNVIRKPTSPSTAHSLAHNIVLVLVAALLSTAVT